MECLNSKTKHRLLIVEDDKGWILILKHMLKSRNVDALYAETGEEALKLVNEHEDVACVFLDVSLGNGISGLELGAILKAKQDFKDTPMIAMTAHDEGVIGDYQQAGFTGYLQKPYSLDQLGDILDSHYQIDQASLHLN